MAAFADVWRRARLYFPDAPALLVQDWIQNGFNSICDRRPWAFLRAETILTTLASRSITVGVTKGLSAITSAGAFLASDAGRQFKIGGIPIYTIASVTDASNAVLDFAYTGVTNAAASATILDLYATMPADFGAFLMVVDPSNQRPIPWWFTEEQLNRVDPARTATDSVSRVLVSHKLSGYAATIGQVQYEYWPGPTSAIQFPALYRQRPPLLSESVNFTGVLKDRADVLILAARVEASRWPGTGSKPNPYFNLNLSRMLGAELEGEIERLTLRDDDQFLQDYSVINWERWNNLSMAYDSHLLRASDSTLGDYLTAY